MELDRWLNAPSLFEENWMMTTFTFSHRYIYTIGGLSNSLHGFVSNIARLDTAFE